MVLLTNKLTALPSVCSCTASQNVLNRHLALQNLRLFCHCLIFFQTLSGIDFLIIKVFHTERPLILMTLCKRGQYNYPHVEIWELNLRVLLTLGPLVNFWQRRDLNWRLSRLQFFLLTTVTTCIQARSTNWRVLKFSKEGRAISVDSPLPLQIPTILLSRACWPLGATFCRFSGLQQEEGICFLFLKHVKACFLNCMGGYTRYT